MRNHPKEDYGGENRIINVSALWWSPGGKLKVLSVQEGAREAQVPCMCPWTFQGNSTGWPMTQMLISNHLGLEH